MVPGTRQDGISHLSPESDTARVIGVADREAKALAEGHETAYFALLTDDAIFLPPSLPSKTGEELREWLGDFLTRFTCVWLNYVHGPTEVAGNLAYHLFSYSWKVSPKTGADGTVGHGKGLHVLRRQADGSWKISHEIWNSSPPDAS